MRIIYNILVCLCVSGLCAVACIGSYHSHNYHLSTYNPYRSADVIIEIEQPEVTQPGVWLGPHKVNAPCDIPSIHMAAYPNLTYDEMELLQQIAMCEARGEDAKGQALVMRVVINRSINSGQSIYNVIYAPGQFATAHMGEYVPNENNNEALGIIIDGWDESEGALFFCNNGYNGSEPLFKYGNHYFSK